MKKAYIALSYSKKGQLSKVVQAITEELTAYSIQSLVFIDEYGFNTDEEKDMMQQAMTDISSCDLLIAETSEKAIGVGIEVGYAKGKDIPIIYLKNNKAEHSTTASGISDYQIVYSDTDNLKQRLREILKELKG